jgi:hypothetical protein
MGAFIIGMIILTVLLAAGVLIGLAAYLRRARKQTEQHEADPSQPKPPDPPGLTRP